MKSTPDRVHRGNLCQSVNSSTDKMIFLNPNLITPCLVCILLPPGTSRIIYGFPLGSKRCVFQIFYVVSSYSFILFCLSVLAYCLWLSLAMGHLPHLWATCSSAVLNPFAPQLALIVGAVATQVQTLHLASLNLMRSSWAHYSSLSRSLWMSLKCVDCLVSSINFLGCTQANSWCYWGKCWRASASVLIPEGHHSSQISIQTWIHLLLLWVKSCNYFLNHWTIHPLNLYLSNLEGSMLWETMSKALLNSR